ncbi:hypothetical protein GCM10009738_29410 [Kitasatospora viridis]|uniref:Uncharacterized protein n=1 Tax=Kitasatospora viridis TaxID=281105 RepID=A0A561UJB9_9ACTN|nr:hypothetical protein FHX73_113292 [Kitasatospora viridis]
MYYDRASLERSSLNSTESTVAGPADARRQLDPGGPPVVWGADPGRVVVRGVRWDQPKIQKVALAKPQSIVATRVITTATKTTTTLV